MYRLAPYTGSELPSKVLCLTYDDGPGKYTQQIAEFLYEQDIQAAFFVVGKYAHHHPDILQKIASLGHLIGNHTYEHPDMPYYLSVSGDVHNQILRTDAVIKNFCDQDIIYFRSPYGKWSSEVANELNLHLLATVNHIGPIYWDIGGIDCYYWKSGFSVEDAVKKYLQDIAEKDHGIVVMHDDIADMDYLKDHNKTLELTKQLIPLLKAQGYKFIRLDEIESIKQDAVSSLRFTLQNTHGAYISVSGDANSMVSLQRKKKNVQNELSLVDMGHGKVALRASNDLFLTLQNQNGPVVEASSKEAGKCEAFDLIPLSANRILLRAYNGNYLTQENKRGGSLLASAQFMRQGERFTFSIVAAPSKKYSLLQRYRMLKRKILFIKSKIQERW